jgi:hypothetical protein
VHFIVCKLYLQRGEERKKRGKRGRWEDGTERNRKDRAEP